MLNSNLRLHSKYQPQAEADRFFKSLNTDKKIDCFILIEPGMGYLINSIKAKHSSSKIIVLHADSVFRNTENFTAGVSFWYPDCQNGIQQFLENEIPENASVKVVEWRAGLQVYGKSYLALINESAQFLNRKEASRRTTAFFGKRWVKNFFRNLAVLQNILLYKTMDIPIVITGSGPSLEKAVSKIIEKRKGIFILAASSSTPALISRGIFPNMVISTDGGNWAKMHLHAAIRQNNLGQMLACSMNSAIPSQCAALKLLPLNEGSLWQSMALNVNGIPSVKLPQRGTVTASAIDLALSLTTGNIFLAGMDLSVSDIKSHVRPYGFDHFFFNASSRMNPAYSQIFKRSCDIKSGGSFDIYKAWFKNQMGIWPNRVFSLSDESIKLDCPSVNNSQDHFIVNSLQNDAIYRQKRAINVLISALEQNEYKEILISELSALLFPGNIEASVKNIIKALSRCIFSL